MENLNAEQVKRGLECCNTIGGCKVCPYSCNGKPTDNGECGEKMSLDALALINRQETEYNELYELCESYRRELGEVKEALVESNKDKKGYQQGAKDIAEKIKKYYKCLGSMTNPCTMEYYIDQVLKESFGSGEECLEKS